jgi:hypothetical protein
LARKRQFTADAKRVQGGQPIVFFQFQHAKGDGQVKAGAFLPDIGRGQVDGDSVSVRPAQPAVENSRGDPVLALLDRGVRQSDNGDLIGGTPSGVDFDFHFESSTPTTAAE